MMKESLLRLAISLDDKAPTTIDRYICKLTEHVLFDNPWPMDVSGICSCIAQTFHLEFDLTEVENAVARRGGESIIITGSVYSLSTKRRNTLGKQATFEGILSAHVNRYLAENDKEENGLYDLILKYIYYSFNTSLENLQTLFNGVTGEATESFSANNDEIDEINAFVSWDDSEKNKFLYDIISFAYEYCLLTTKKDSALSKQIFSGKVFYIDSNVIFRLAGINNNERKITIDKFVAKCKEVGIQLCYTSETLSEIFRVATAQVKYIVEMTHGQEPINPEIIIRLDGNYEVNGFYETYYAWCQNPGNRHNDYSSFQQYLNNKLQEALSIFKPIDITKALQAQTQDDFLQKTESLMQYKSLRIRTRQTSKESVSTDVKNVFYVLNQRNRKAEQNLWQTNDYFVSADQKLIAWASETYGGIPLVVIPSVWLSIILRFSGRSDDDYRSFCMFLQQRHHPTENGEGAINPGRVFSELAKRTTLKQVKEKVIIEMLDHRDEYSFVNNDDYAESIDKAFDKTVMELEAKGQTKREEIEKQYVTQVSALEDSLKKKEIETVGLQEEVITNLVNNETARRMNRRKRIMPVRYFLWILAIVLWLAVTAGLLYDIPRISPWVVSAMPKAFTSIHDRFEYLKWVGVAIGVFFAAVGEFIKYMCSDQAVLILRARIYAKRKKDINV